MPSTISSRPTGEAKSCSIEPRSHSPATVSAVSSTAAMAEQVRGHAGHDEQGRAARRVPQRVDLDRERRRHGDAGAALAFRAHDGVDLAHDLAGQVAVAAVDEELDRAVAAGGQVALEAAGNDQRGHGFAPAQRRLGRRDVAARRGANSSRAEQGADELRARPGCDPRRRAASGMRSTSKLRPKPRSSSMTTGMAERDVQRARIAADVQHLLGRHGGHAPEETAQPRPSCRALRSAQGGQEHVFERRLAGVDLDVAAARRGDGGRQAASRPSAAGSTCRCSPAPNGSTASDAGLAAQRRSRPRPARGRAPGTRGRARSVRLSAAGVSSAISRPAAIRPMRRQYSASSR